MNTMTRKTIIMLSAKRCGSTAIFRMFQKHPEVGVCHVDSNIDNWEPNFWNLGAEAIAGFPDGFISRFSESHPFIRFPNKFTEASLFRLWDDILEELGPVVFDKSPKYLGNKAAFELLYKYIMQGNDVRLFAFIRDPRDAISSQYTLWSSFVKGDSPKRRELAWLEQYNHLATLQKDFNIPLFRYEDFCVAPSCYAYNLFQHCGCAFISETFEHIKPTSVGRYSRSTLPSLKAWKFSVDFTEHIKIYGYRIPQQTLLERTRMSANVIKVTASRVLISLKEKLIKVRNGLV